MLISESLVRELQKKIDISYEEAEYFLKRARGNVDLAQEMIIHKRNSTSERIKSGVHQMFYALMEYRFIITRKGEILINLPLILLILIFMMMGGFYNNVFLFVFILVLILATECEVKLNRKEKRTSQCEKNIDKDYKKTDGQGQADSAFEHKKSPVKTSRENSQEPVAARADSPENRDRSIPDVEKKDDDFYEIVIED